MSRDADGAVHMTAQACGYESTLVPVSVVNSRRDAP